MPRKRQICGDQREGHIGRQRANAMAQRHVRVYMSLLVTSCRKKVRATGGSKQDTQDDFQEVMNARSHRTLKVSQDLEGLKRP